MQDLAKTREEVEHWASTDYAQALAKGDALSPEERQKIIDAYARYTGLDRKLIDNANLRIDVEQFTLNLLLDQKVRVGRLDGRFTGPDPEGVLDSTRIRSDGLGDRSSLHCGVQQLPAYGTRL